MEFFSERRIERHSEYNTFYTHSGNIVLLNKPINGDLGLSLPLDNKLFGVTHLVINAQTKWRGESSQAPAATLSFYVLPRTMRGRTTRASQRGEWVKLPSSSVNVPVDKTSIITFEHSDLTKAGLKAESLTAAVTIPGNSQAGSSLELKVFRKATQDEVTDSVIEDETILVTVLDIQSLLKSNHAVLTTKIDNLDNKLDQMSYKLDLLLNKS